MLLESYFEEDYVISILFIVLFCNIAVEKRVSEGDLHSAARSVWWKGKKRGKNKELKTSPGIELTNKGSKDRDQTTTLWRQRQDLYSYLLVLFSTVVSDLLIENS